MSAPVDNLISNTHRHPSIFSVSSVSVCGGGGGTPGKAHQVLSPAVPRSRCPARTQTAQSGATAGGCAADRGRGGGGSVTRAGGCASKGGRRGDRMDSQGMKMLARPPVEPFALPMSLMGGDFCRPAG